MATVRNRGLVEILADQAKEIRRIKATLARSGAGAGATDHGALTGLTGDDHLHYHTDARALTWLGTRSTTDLSEGTNLYYTNTRADARITLHAALPSAHHVKYTDGEAVSAVGTPWVGLIAAEDHHSRYTNSEVDTRISLAVTDDLLDVTITNVQAGEIMYDNGAGWINATLAEAGVAAASHGDHHTKYTDGEAVAAVGTPWIGLIAAEDHHTKYLNSEAVAAVLADDNYVKIAGDTMTGNLLLDKAGATITIDGDSSTGLLQIRRTTQTGNNLSVSRWENDGIIGLGSANTDQNIRFNQSGYIRFNAGQSGAALEAMRILANLNLDLKTHSIINVADPSGAQDAATKNYVDGKDHHTKYTDSEAAAKIASDALYLPKTGGAMTGDLSFAALADTISMGSNVGDRLYMWGTIYGFGIQSANLVAFTGGPTSKFSVRDSSSTGTEGAYFRPNGTAGINGVLTMGGAIAMGTNKITGLGTPSVGTDAANKTYVDGKDHDHATPIEIHRLASGAHHTRYSDAEAIAAVGTVANGVPSGSSLPGSGIAGDLFFLTTDKKLYRHDGTVWLTTVPVTDLTGQIVAAQITAGTITANEIDTNTITAGNIKAGAIEASELATNAVTADAILAGAITTVKMSVGSIDGDRISANTLDAAKITAGSITTLEMAANSVDTSELVADAVTVNELAANSVVTGSMVSNTINGDRITTNTLTAAKITAGTITTDRMTAGTIDGDRISTNSLDAGRIVAGTITTDRMTANTISGDRITAGTLQASKIVAGTITTDRMTSNSINGDRITAGTLQASKIVAGTITTDRMSSNSIHGDRITSNTLQAAKIVAGTITADRMNITSLDALTANMGTLTVNEIIDLSGTGEIRSDDGAAYYALYPWSGSNTKSMEWISNDAIETASAKLTVYVSNPSGALTIQGPQIKHASIAANYGSGRMLMGGTALDGGSGYGSLVSTAAGTWDSIAALYAQNFDGGGSGDSIALMQATTSGSGLGIARLDAEDKIQFQLNGVDKMSLAAAGWTLGTDFYTSGNDIVINNSGATSGAFLIKDGGSRNFDFYHSGGAGNQTSLARFFGNGGDTMDMWIDGELQVDGGLKQNTWIDASLINGWLDHSATFHPAQYRLTSDKKHVEIRGMIKSGTTTAATVVFTLPSGLRPTKQYLLGIYGGNGAARVDIKTNGQFVTNTNWSSNYMAIDCIIAID